MSVKKFAVSTVVLLVAGLIVRLLGFIYRIYLSNLIGAEGMGLYQLVIPLYSLIVLTLTAGVSITASRMIAAEVKVTPDFNPSRIVKAGMCVSSAGGALVALIVPVFAEYIATKFLGDYRTILSIKVLIPCIPVVAGAAALKGYYYGVQRVAPAAFAQVVEQIVRIGFVMVLAGRTEGLGLEHLCAIAVGAAALGEGANLAVLAIIYPAYSKRGKHKKYRLSRRKTVMCMFSESAPISLNRFITSVMSAVEMALIPNRLIAGGMQYKTAIEQFGIMSGMVFPLLAFPSLVTSSLSTSLVAEISGYAAHCQFGTVNMRITKSITITTVMGFLFNVIFFLMPNEIASLAFDFPGVGDMLRMLSFGCLFLYLQQTLTGVMNGLGKQKEVLSISLTGYAVRIGIIFFFVGDAGMTAYIVSAVISSLIVCIYYLYKISKTTGLSFDGKNWIFKPLCSAAAVYIAFPFFKEVTYGLTSDSIIAGKLTVLLLICICGGVFTVILAALGMKTYLFGKGKSDLYLR